MKNYMKNIVKNMVGFVKDENKVTEILRSNSYNVLNVSPRFF